MKELEDENRRLKNMYAKEKLKAETVKEALEKIPDTAGQAQWLRHLTVVRWRNAPTVSLVLRYALAALLLVSVKPVIGIKLSCRLQTMK